MTTQYSSGNYQSNGLLSVPALKEHILCNKLICFGVFFEV